MDPAWKREMTRTLVLIVPDAVEAHVTVVHLVDVPPVDQPTPLPRPGWQLDPEHLAQHTALLHHTRQTVPGPSAACPQGRGR